MRQTLCIKTRYLDVIEQENIKNDAYNYLNDRWSFLSDETLITSKYLVKDRNSVKKGKKNNDFVSFGARSRLIKQLKKAEFWKNTSFAEQIFTWKGQELVDAVQIVLNAAYDNGYVHKQSIDNSLLGWKLNAAKMVWCLPDNNDSQNQRKTNAFFRELYLTTAEILNSSSHSLFEFEAQEHTAQVDASRRQLLEQRFRYTEKDCKDWSENPAHDAPLERLPVMFCSPTMELGVDISALNTVYLRNVPPTPANYAQRSGRAGRSGQQALVITYCAAQSPHDQWFFNHADKMVHGIVKPPTLDLAKRRLAILLPPVSE